MPETKWCGKCGEDKPKSEFWKYAKADDGLQYYCKLCANEKRREWDRNRRLNPKRKRELQRRDRAYHSTYYSRTREQQREKERQRHAKNRHESIVYAVTAGPTRVKVGTTTNRRHVLTTYRRFAPDAQIIWEHPGGRELEADLHYELSDYNVPHTTGRSSEVFEIDHDRAIRMLTVACEVREAA